MARVAPAGRHIAYEPLPHLAALLVDSFPTVDVRQAALSDHTGVSTFAYVHGPAEGCSGLLPCTIPAGYDAEVEQITVRLETLDGALKSDSRPTLIKLDVEGAEQQVLEGALGTIRRHRPIVIFEHAYTASNIFGTRPRDVYALLCEEAGLRIFDLDANGPYTLPEFEQASYAGERVNFLARP